MSQPSHSVHVSGLSASTTEAHIHDFFTFCGKISSIDYNEKAEPKSAVIHFEKPSAAKTALMLNGGTLDGAHLTVTSDIVHSDEEDDGHSHHFEQSDKPRAGIAAEYLAKGYTLSDTVLQRAIEMDNKQGISKRFLRYMNHLDSTIGSKVLGPDQTLSGKVQSTATAATQQARSVDEQKGFSKTAGDYYSKAISSPFGQKVLAFYTTTSKQVLDIHEEAKRISSSQKASGSATNVPPTTTAPLDKSTEAAPTVV